MECIKCRWFVYSADTAGKMRYGCDNEHIKHVTDRGFEWWTPAEVDPNSDTPPDFCPYLRIQQ